MAKSQRTREPRNYRILAGALIVAALFWFAVTMGGSFVAQYNIPLTVMNLPEDVALAEQLPAEIEVALEGTGWQLIFLSIGDQLQFEVPGKRLLKQRSVKTLSLMSEAIKLPSGVKVIRAYPEELSIAIDKMVKKKVPILLPAISMTFREGFGLTGDVSIEPDSVILTGAEKVLKGITSWSASPGIYSNLSLPVQEDIVLNDSLGRLIELNPNKTQITIPIEQLADMSFDNVVVRVDGVPPGKEVLLLHSSVKVFVRGGVNTLSNLSDEDFTALIDYVSIKADSTGSVTPLVIIPYTITLLKVEPDKIRYTVRQN
jgi:YbbR domain-containing protein